MASVVERSMVADKDANSVTQPQNSDERWLAIERIERCLRTARPSPAVGWVEKTKQFELLMVTGERAPHFPHAGFATTFKAFRSFVISLRKKADDDAFQESVEEEILEDDL